jgi:hypothetical protein
MQHSKQARKYVRDRFIMARLRGYLIDRYFVHRETIRSCSFSLLSHFLLAVILTFILFTPIQVKEPKVLISSRFQTENEAQPLEEIVIPQELIPSVKDNLLKPIEVKDLITQENAAQIDININDFVPAFDLDQSLTRVSLDWKSSFSGRSQKARAALVALQGGSAESERSVELGLQWLANHQNDDGSWSFDHVQNDLCGNSCTESGQFRQCQMGATAMALLSFLGAGQTHREGKYQIQVAAGIDFLLENMKVEKKRVRGRSKSLGDFRGRHQGNSGMYVQGLAAIVLCEACGLTKDKKLRRPAQSALNFIFWAQDHAGGGWRYQPGQPGDTSVVGWQVMAIASARMAKLTVPARTRRETTRFLDSVQSNRGAMYGYMTPGQEPSTSSIGLLCRMYLGWKSNNPALQQGIEYLSNVGPSEDNMYYNYYATQVMHHLGGKPWKKWNDVMRDRLIETQRKDGHARGSWDPRDRHSGPGGRLYMTSLCIMTLEVYYRYLPLYQQRAIKAEY